jgi:hypothetical protein
MKYIGAAILILVGVLIIAFTAAVPGFTTVIVSPIKPVNYHMLYSYPSSSTNYTNPTIFPSSSSVKLTVKFSTDYVFSQVDMLKTSVKGTVTIFDFTTNTVVGVYSTDWVVNIQLLSPTLQYYAINAVSSYTFNNPIIGGTHIYEFTWYSTLTYTAKLVNDLNYTTKTTTATGQAGYGQFSPLNVYPGYFVLENCTTTWKPIETYFVTMNNNSVINIIIPPSQDYAYLNFIYVEYNASGNTLANFVKAYISITPSGSTETGQWVLTNSTTYNNYPALYAHVKLPPGKYIIKGYAVYKINQNIKTVELFEMSSTWNTTQSGQFPQVTVNDNQLINYIVGSLLIVLGAIDAWRWHI